MSKSDRHNFLKGVVVGLVVMLFLLCPFVLITLGDIRNEAADTLLQPHPSSIILNSIDRLANYFVTFTVIGIVGLVSLVGVEIKDRKKRQGLPRVNNA